MWRFGVGRWTVIVLGMPALTVGLAAATGTLDTPQSGWSMVAANYLFSTLIFGALIIDVWEEAAWGGFVQSRLMARHGLLVSSLLTAPLFAGIHVPLQFADDPTTSDVLGGAALLFGPRPSTDTCSACTCSTPGPHPGDGCPARRLERYREPRPSGRPMAGRGSRGPISEPAHHLVRQSRGHAGG
jgi:hypothetical protein